jgi:DNA-binding response OmpR family regulator
MNQTSGRVLIMEDDSLIAFDVAATLERHLKVPVFWRRFDASVLARLLATDPPDLMMIELYPWQDDRFKLVRAAIAAGSRVLIGTVSDEARNGMAGLDGIPVLVKPYDPGRLTELAKQELAAHSRSRPSEQMPAW